MNSPAPIPSPRGTKKSKKKDALNLTSHDSPHQLRRSAMSPYTVLPDTPVSPTSPCKRPLSPISPNHSSLSPLSQNKFFGPDFVTPDEWKNQPRRRSLTPIPEMRINNAPLDLATEERIKVDQNQEREPDFVHEFKTPAFKLDDIKVVIDGSKIRVIGECSEETPDNSFPDFYKSIPIPQHIDPLSFKIHKTVGKITIRGYNTKLWDAKKIADQKNKNSKEVCEEYIECVVPLSNGFNQNSLKIKTVTKHFLVVSHTGDQKGINESVYELPTNADLENITSRPSKDNAAIIHIPVHKKCTNSTLVTR